MLCKGTRKKLGANLRALTPFSYGRMRALHTRSMRNLRIFLFLFSALCALLLCFCAPAFSARSEAPVKRGGSLIVEGEEYPLSLEMEADKYLFAMRFGSLENYARFHMEKGILPSRVLDYLHEGAGLAFFAFLDSLETQPQNATLRVENTSPYFIYTAGEEGKTFDKKQAALAYCRALEGKKSTLSLRDTPPEITQKDLRERTRLLSKFTTSAAGSTQNRKHNISLALSRINGTILASGERFSFNERVGERTAENGFASAKVIENGRYVQGVGGGVCQAATTLYNSVLRAGIHVLKVARHTFPPSYVAPSLDAMVSAFSDLVFVNESPYPAYIFCKLSGDTVCVETYGYATDQPKIVSQVIEEIPFDKVNEKGEKLLDTAG